MTRAVLIVAGAVVVPALAALWWWGRHRGIGVWRAALTVLFGLYLAVILARTGERPGGAHGGRVRERPPATAQPAGRPDRGRSRGRRDQEGVMRS